MRLLTVHSPQTSFSETGSSSPKLWGERGPIRHRHVVVVPGESHVPVRVSNPEQLTVSLCMFRFAPSVYFLNKKKKREKRTSFSSVQLHWSSLPAEGIRIHGLVQFIHAYHVSSPVGHHHSRKRNRCQPPQFYHFNTLKMCLVLVLVRFRGYTHTPASQTRTNHLHWRNQASDGPSPHFTVVDRYRGPTSTTNNSKSEMKRLCYNYARGTSTDPSSEQLQQHVHRLYIHSY